MDAEDDPSTGVSPADGSSGPTVLRILVGSHLKRLRESRGTSRTVAAHAIRGSEAKISRVESGRVGFKRRDIEDLLTLYGLPDGQERRDLLALADKANEPGWWQPFNDVIPDWMETYVGLEQAASTIRTYEPQFVPGLLQTEEYARAVIEMGRPGRTDEIKRKLDLRMGRQRVMEQNSSVGYWAIVDEAALRRPTGGPDVMRAQLEHLLAAAERPNVTLQVLTLEQSAAAASGGPFILLRFADPELSDVVYLEQLTSALYLDKRADVETYLVLIDRLAAAALPPRRSTALIASLRGKF